MKDITYNLLKVKGIRKLEIAQISFVTLRGYLCKMISKLIMLRLDVIATFIANLCLE